MKKIRNRRKIVPASVAVAACFAMSGALLLIDESASALRRISAVALAIGASAAFVYFGAAIRRDLRVPIDRLARAVRRVEEGEYEIKDLCWVRASDVELKDLVRGVLRLAENVQARDTEHRSIQSSLRRMNEIRDQVLSSISHELRTPVTSIVAFSEILAQMSDVEDDRRVEFANVVHRESRRLQTIVESVLDMASYAAGDATSAKSPISVAELVSAVITGTCGSGHDERKRPEAQVVLSGMDGEWVFVDVARTRKALRSLVDNALRFSPAGAKVDIRFVKSDEPGREGATAFEVEDRGRGIAREARSFVFDLFRQGGEVLSDKPAGLGLGLPLARVCMRAQGGDVEMVRTGETGSVFRLIMPRDAGAVETGRQDKPVVVAERRGSL